MTAYIPFSGELDGPEQQPVYVPFDGELDVSDGAEASASSAAQEHRASWLGRAARDFGIGARGVVQGLTDLPAMVTDNLIAKPMNAGLDALLGKGAGPRAKMLGETVGDLMTKAGVPEPRTAGERVAVDVNRGAAGAVVPIAAGAGLARTGSAVAQGVGKMLMAGPKTQVASGATGALASGVARESGAGEGAQMAAGLAGSMAPSLVPYAAAAATRGILRGGEGGRRQLAQNIKAFEDAAGTTPTLGQGTQRRAVQAAETMTSNYVGGAGVMAKRGEAQATALKTAVQRITDELSPDASGWGAGEAIKQGVNAFKDSVKTTQRALYARLDDLIPAHTPVNVARTKEALAALNDGIEGAPSLSKFFRNAKMGSIERALLDDLDSFAQGQVPAGMQGTGVTVQPGQLPYQAIQKLRTLVGQEISDGSLVSDVPRSKWRALYAALSDDLGTAAEAAGPKAQQAWSRANQYTKASIARLDQLETIVNRDAPEKVFKVATSGLADGGTQIARLMKSMPLEHRREVTAAVLQRLGRATPGMQNELGDAFSSETFLTNLSKMSAPARRALFRNSGFDNLELKVEAMGRMASLRREGAQVLSNPSGTARQAAAIAYWGGLAGAIGAGSAPAILALSGTAVGSNAAAKLLTSPRFVKLMAEQTAMNPAAPAVAASALSRADQMPQAPAADAELQTHQPPAQRPPLSTFMR